MKRYSVFPIIILGIIVVLVPVIRCALFFDSYLIKLWLVQFGVAILLIYFFGHGSLRINTTVSLLLLAYLLINIASWLLIPFPHRYPALLTLLSLFVYIFLCFFVSQYLTAPRAQSILVLLWIITTAGISIYSICQYMQNSKVIGTLGNENFLASHIGITIPICIGLFWGKKKVLLLPGVIPPRENPGRKSGDESAFGMSPHRGVPDGTTGVNPWGSIIFILFCAVLYLTHSRGAWLGLISGLGSFAIIGWGPKGKRLIISIVLILVVIGLALTPWGIRFIAVEFQGDVRPAIWEGTIYMITEKPLLGCGKGAYFIFYPKFRLQDYWLTKSPTDLTTHAHNEFLQILAETGLIGLGIFLALISTVLRLGIKRIDEIKNSQRYLLLGIASGIIGLLAHNLVCNNLQMPSSAVFLWFMLGVLISPSPLPSPRGTPTRSGSGEGWVRGPFRYVIFLVLLLFISIIMWQIWVRPIMSQYLFKDGWRYREKEKWDLAIEKYERAISWYPWDVEMYYRTAYAYTMNGQYDKAIERYNDVIRLAPLYGSVHRNMGIIYSKKGENRDAVRSFLQALQINENDVITLINLNRIRGRYADE